MTLTQKYSKFSGGQNYDEAVAFIKLKFAELNLNPEKKTIYMHETCATDTNQVSLYEFQRLLRNARLKLNGASPNRTFFKLKKNESIIVGGAHN